MRPEPANRQRWEPESEGHATVVKARAGDGGALGRIAPGGVVASSHCLGRRSCVGWWTVTRVSVVAYPNVAAVDRAWIEAVRVEHDPQAARLGAHFTLVFPAEVAAAPMVARVQSVAASCRPFAFALAEVKIVRDAATLMWHVFLVPTSGQAELRALHERLYDGELRRHLREDVPFVPHVTVAASADEAACARLAARLEQEGRVVCGRVDSLDVVEVVSAGVHRVAAVPLGDSA